jgi:hypothetical protein
MIQGMVFFMDGRRPKTGKLLIDPRTKYVASVHELALPLRWLPRGAKSSGVAFS